MTKPFPLSGIACILLVAFCPPCISWAQEAAEAADQQPKKSLIRAWIIPSSESDAVAVSLKSARDESPTVLAISKGGNREINPGYLEVNPGNTSFEIKPEQGEEILAQTAGPLQPERQYTAVAWKNGGKWQLKVFPDGPVTSKAAERPLRFLNFAQGRETLATIGQDKEGKIPPDAISEVKLPPKISGIVVKVLAPDGGPPAQSSTEVDFTIASSAYVVVGPDYRGRMRPRVITGGEIPVVDPAAPLE